MCYGAVFFSNRVEPAQVGYRFGDPIYVKVMIQNLTGLDIPIGDDGVIKPNLWFDVDASSSGPKPARLPGVAFERIGISTVLPAKGRAALGAAVVVLIAALVVLPSITRLMNPRGARTEAASAPADVPPAATPAVAQASTAQARAWSVDAAQSTLGFKGTYQGGGFDGTFKRFDATIAYDEADLAHSKFDVRIDLASADTGSSERDDTLKGDDFFATAKFPQAHFITESFEKAADGVRAHGTLTIRDRTAPVVLAVTFAATGDKATLDVDTVLERADYGLGAGTDWTDVGADVPVHGHLVLAAK